ncbi:hypothetical protein FNF29_01400 [Cafeteria roenbergensis]|uniref:Uncharacterized protein n=1 Tax=Cafeteria roenbergensis TaxID=33653 RepID=A0A5A8CVV0_CAFRO|nr:hypothetical protein FNF29_01400 [Cafeteria roenbergensis]|eukprot:KAA0155981.1 hypothetical protein FNF29_01400 [Cafeteria roenbergensis]
MSDRLLVNATHVDSPSVKKRVALSASEEWSSVLAKLQAKFSMGAPPAAVLVDGAHVESVEELAPGDLLVVHGPAASGGVATTPAPSSQPPAAASAAGRSEASPDQWANAIQLFYQTNKLHTGELLAAVRTLKVLSGYWGRSEDKFRRVRLSKPALQAALGPPIRGVEELLCALGFVVVGTDSPLTLELPAGAAPAGVTEAFASLEAEILPYVPALSLSSRGSDALRAVQAGMIKPPASARDVSGALHSEAARGGADVRERLAAARARMAAVSRNGYRGALERGMAAPPGLDRAWSVVEASLGPALSTLSSAGSAAGAAAASAAGDSKFGAGGASTADELRAGIGLFRYLGRPAVGRGKLEEEAIRAEARCTSAEEGQTCTVRLEFDDGSRVFGTFRLDEPVAAVCSAAAELVAPGIGKLSAASSPIVVWRPGATPPSALPSGSSPTSSSSSAAAAAAAEAAAADPQTSLAELGAVKRFALRASFAPSAGIKLDSTTPGWWLRDDLRRA